MATRRRGVAGQWGVRGQVSGRILRRPDRYEGVAAKNDFGFMVAVFD
jgi:hypothetical protein